ncbi:hypothetical protein RJ639_028599 [Escallonia herrerae]|uniref:tRNA pseudouridine(55) synthase n=1 Tax=Escallonia herrerae TaxID=1293975 RepID=A0AA88X2T1_9ASTE|nr:hypothetical protein RJ639_028599 [Escallonia herrerae]
MDASPTEAAQVVNGHGQAQVVPAEELTRLTYAVRDLPAHAVQDLLSVGCDTGMCPVWCIFRLFGVHECICSCSLMPQSTLCSILAKSMDLEGDTMVNGVRAHEDSSSVHSYQEPDLVAKCCIICLGILQFVYIDHQESLVKTDCPYNFALTIADVVKQQSYQLDNFSLEVSLPPIVTENEQAVWLYMKRKHASELWYQEKFISERILTKDVLKLCITKPLETLLGVKAGVSSSRIRLTYTHLDTSVKVQNTAEANQSNKKRKTGMLILLCQPHTLYLQCDISDCLKSLSEKVNQPCLLALLCNRSPIYIGGRYLKYSRNVSQSRWIVDDERIGEASVEEIIGSNILPFCRGDNYKFHAAGREDIDVKVKNLKVLGSQGWALMHEGEAEKQVYFSLCRQAAIFENLYGPFLLYFLQKQYAALVWIPRSLKDDDVQTISLLKDMAILQRTPIRVLHRRSPLEREKIIHWMKVERVAGSSQYFLLHLCTQVGYDLFFLFA